MAIQDLRAGIIGTGFIGPVHLEALRRLGVQVSAICDVGNLADQAAERFGIPESYNDYRAMLSSRQVDVVHITSPNRFHCAMSLAAIKAGKHVICEKPLAMNTEETRSIVTASRAHRRVFAVNYNIRFYPAVLQLRRMIARGDLGDIIHVNGSYFQDWLFKDTDYNWRLLPKEGGKLRAVADIGTHWMDTVSFVLGARIQSVLADLGTYHRERKRPLGEVRTFTQSSQPLDYAAYRVRTEDFANLLLQFSNGARGNLGVSQVAAGRKNCIRLEIYGSRQSAWWNSENPEMLHCGHRDEANQTAIRNTPPFGPDAAPFLDYPAGHVEGFPDTFKMLFRSVYSAIDGAGKRSERLFASVEDGHAEVAVCEAVLKSHQAKAWVKV